MEETQKPRLDVSEVLNAGLNIGGRAWNVRRDDSRFKQTLWLPTQDQVSLLGAILLVGSQRGLMPVWCVGPTDFSTHYAAVYYLTGLNLKEQLLLLEGHV